MSYVPYKLILQNSTNSSLIETNAIDGLTITEDNIKLAGSVNINNNYTLPTTSPVSGNYLLNSNNGALSFTTYTPVSVSQFQYNLYVSSSGNDSNDGTISSPKLTIAGAMAFVNTLSANTNVSINLASGTYTEAVLITKSGVSIIGNSAIGCVINGDIGVGTIQNSSFYAITEISNVQINGQIVINNTTLYTNSLILNNVVCNPSTNFSCLIANSTGGGLLADITVKNSVFYVSNNTVGVNLLNASLTMVGTQIQNNPTLSNTTENFIKAVGASRVNLFGCSLYQASTSASVKALIEIANTSNATSSSTINNSIFLFTSSTSTTTGAVMNFSNTASSNTYNFYLNYCKCNVSVNSPNNYIVLKSSTGAVSFVQGNNLGTSSNHTLPNSGSITGWTKTTMSAVV